ncbi:MAG: hypothetical protein H7A38_04870 [Chlamydiales bacterium]|nr:hypothetical protein [Chlamydiales bacterium]
MDRTQPSTLHRKSTYFHLGAIGVATLLFGSKKVIHYFPNASRQGAYLLGGALCASSLLYDLIRYDAKRSAGQTNLEKTLCLTAISLLTPTLPLSARLTLALTSSLFLSFFTQAPAPAPQPPPLPPIDVDSLPLAGQHAYYRTHPEAWIALDAEKRNQRILSFFKADLPPIYVCVENSDAILPRETVQDTFKAPDGASNATLRWILFLHHGEYLSKENQHFFEVCIERNLPICNFLCSDCASYPFLKGLFQREPLYYYQYPKMFQEMRPDNLPSKEELSAQYTPEKIVELPPHLIMVLQLSRNELSLSLHAELALQRRLFDLDHPSRSVSPQALKEALYQTPQDFTNDDLAWWIGNCEKMGPDDPLHVTKKNRLLVMEAHRRKIILPPFIAHVDDVLPNDPKAKEDYQTLLKAYPRYFYLLGTASDHPVIQELKNQIPSLESLLSKITPDQVAGMPREEMSIWYSIIEYQIPKIASETLQAFALRFYQEDCQPMGEKFLWEVDRTPFFALKVGDVENLTINQLDWYHALFFTSVESLNIESYVKQLKGEEQMLAQVLQKLDDQAGFFTIATVGPTYTDQFAPGVIEVLKRRILKLHDPHLIETLKRIVAQELPFSSHTDFTGAELTKEEAFLLFGAFPDILFPLTDHYVDWIVEDQEGRVPKLIEAYNDGDGHHKSFMDLSQDHQDRLRAAFGKDQNLLPYTLTSEFVEMAREDTALQDQIIFQCSKIKIYYTQNFGFLNLPEEDQKWVTELFAQKNATLPLGFKPLKGFTKPDNFDQTDGATTFFGDL